MNRFGIFLVFLAFIIICGVAFFTLNPYKQIADNNDNIRKTGLQKMSIALEKYYSDYGYYPESSLQDYTVMVDGLSLAWGSSWDPYIAFLPKDPSFNRKYAYVSNSVDNYQSYRLYASLQDPASEKNACSVTNECANVPAKNICGENMPCNFAITSSNTSP